MRYIVFFVTMLFACFSCSKNEQEDMKTGEGTLKFSLTAEDNESFINVVTKGKEELVNPDSLQVAIYNSKGVAIISFDTYKKMKENDGKGMPLSLPVGSYTIKAWYDNANKVSQVPYLYSEEPFEIMYNAISKVNMNCQYQCIKLSVQTTATFDKVCKSNYSVRVVTDANEEVRLTKEGYYTFLRKECGKMNAWVDVETVDGRILSFSYDLIKKDKEAFQWKNSVVVKLDIQDTKSLNIETEVR